MPSSSRNCHCAQTLSCIRKTGIHCTSIKSGNHSQDFLLLPNNPWPSRSWLTHCQVGLDNVTCSIMFTMVFPNSMQLDWVTVQFSVCSYVGQLSEVIPAHFLRVIYTTPLQMLPGCFLFHPIQDFMIHFRFEKRVKLALWLDCSSWIMPCFMMCLCWSINTHKVIAVYVFSFSTHQLGAWRDSLGTDVNMLCLRQSHTENVCEHNWSIPRHCWCFTMSFLLHETAEKPIVTLYSVIKSVLFLM